MYIVGTQLSIITFNHDRETEKKNIHICDINFVLFNPIIAYIYIYIFKSVNTTTLNKRTVFHDIYVLVCLKKEENRHTCNRNLFRLSFTDWKKTPRYILLILAGKL